MCVFVCMCVYVRVKLFGFDKLRIQGRMHVFDKISQKALNLVLTLPDYRSCREFLESSVVIDLQHENNISVAKQCFLRLLVPMPYISLWEHKMIKHSNRTQLNSWYNV